MPSSHASSVDLVIRNDVAELATSVEHSTGKEGKPEPVIAKISQETLAEMVGTTERVSYFMNKFWQLGFINYNGGIEVAQPIVERHSARPATDQKVISQRLQMTIR
jgi:hypothetical protein